MYLWDAQCCASAVHGCVSVRRVILVIPNLDVLRVALRYASYVIQIGCWRDKARRIAAPAWFSQSANPNQARVVVEAVAVPCDSTYMTS